MKNRILIALALVAAVAASAWYQMSRNTGEPVAQAPVSGQPEAIHLKFGHDMPESSSQNLAAMRFADVVGYKTKGRVKIDVFPGQALGTDQQMIEMARTGELAIILPPTAKLVSLVPEMQVLDLPFLFNDRKQLYRVLDGTPGQALLEKLEPHGLIGAAFWESGFKQFTANRPIRLPGDFRGLNIRVMRSDTIMDLYKAFGANPVLIDFHETYQALADKVADGQENPLVSIVNMKFHEVQSHVTISNHSYLAQAMVFSRVVMDSLAPDIRDLLISTAREITPFERNDIVENEKRLIEEIRAAGVDVHFPDPAEQAAFQGAADHILSGFHLKPGGEILSMFRQYMDQTAGADRDEVILGLNADISAGSGLSGQAIKRGMELAVAKINQAGGILGRNVRIVVRDNSGISDRGRDNMTEFGRMDNLLAVLCGIYSPIALAELDIVHQEKIILLNPWAAATAIVDNGYSPNYVFRVSVRDAYAGPFLVEKAIERSRKIALLLVNDGWGMGNRKTMTQTLANHGLEPMMIQQFNWGEADMTPQLDLIEQSGADIIVMVAGAIEGATIIKNMAARARQLPIISHWGITGGNFWTSVNQELKKVDLSFLQSYSFFRTPNTASRALMDAYFETYGVDHPGKIFAPVGTAHAYDLVHLVARAAEKAGTIRRPEVREALLQIDEHMGVVKHYKPPFTPGRHDALDQSSFLLCRYDDQGYIIPLDATETPD